MTIEKWNMVQAHRMSEIDRERFGVARLNLKITKIVRCCPIISFSVFALLFFGGRVMCVIERQVTNSNNAWLGIGM